MHHNFLFWNGGARKMLVPHLEDGAVSLTRNLIWQGERAWDVNASGQGKISYSVEHALVELVRICQKFHCVFWEQCNVTRYLKGQTSFGCWKVPLLLRFKKVPTQVPKGYHKIKNPFKKEIALLHAARPLEFLGKLFQTPF